MIKKFVCILLAMICVMSFASCTPVTDANNESSISLESSTHTTTHSASNTSALDADKLVLRNVEIYDNYAVLPLCDVIINLGLLLTWDDNDRATFYCNEIEYEISISEKTLTKSGDDFNYLICAPGNGYFVCDVMDGILMVDDNTVACLFNTFIKYPIYVSINRDDDSVTVTKR